MFSFLYRVFYDRTLFFSYIKNGKGWGLKLLLILTLFAAFCVALRLFLLFVTLSPKLIDDFTAKVPEIVIQNGQIVSPQDRFYSYVSDNKNTFLIFDTTGNPVRLTDFPPIGIYITKEALISVRQSEINRIPFIKILKSDISLNQDDIRNALSQAASISKITAPLLVFFFCIPGIYGTYLILSAVAIFLSFAMTHFLKAKLTFEERCRLAVLSVLPAGVINSLDVLLRIEARTDLICFAALAVYMYCFLKDGQKTPYNVVS